MVRRKLVRRKYRGRNSVRDARKTPESIRMEMRIRGVTMVRIHGIEAQSVAKAFGVCSSCVSRWLARYDNGGLDALGPAKVSKKGRRLLTEDQEETLCHLVLTSNPSQHGFVVNLWTRKTVAMLIEKKFGVKLSERTAGRITRMGRPGVWSGKLQLCPPTVNLSDSMSLG